MPSKIILVDLDLQNAARVRNVLNPVNPQDVATKAYVDSYLEGLAWKDDVRVATTSNISLTTPPSTIDGVTLAVGDRILVKDQTTQSENGIYIYNGTGNALSRAPDADNGAELNAAVVSVREGTTNGGTTWRQTTPNPTLGTSPIVWQQFGTLVPDATETTAGKIRIATQSETNAGTIDNAAVTPLKLKNASFLVRKYATTFGDGTNTYYDLTHNLGTTDVVVAIYKTSTNEEVTASVTVLNANAVRIQVNAAPGNNALRAVIIG